MLTHMSFTITISIFLAGLICFFMFGCADEIVSQRAIASWELPIVFPSKPSTTQVDETKSSHAEVQILQVSTFHGDEVSAKSGGVWFGLYSTQNGYELIPSKITVTAIHDPVVDRED